MTSDELKQSISMREIVSKYGFQPNRAGFISCPFHKGDRTPSMKIYPKDYHCHACGANGDIFSFVQQIEGVSFKEAFYSLGGSYEKRTFASELAQYQSEKRRKMAQKELEKQQSRKELNNSLITLYRAYMKRSEPFSEVWCDCYNALQYQLYIQSEINEMEAWW